MATKKNENIESDEKSVSEMTPQEYFDTVKDMKKHCDDEELRKCYETSLSLFQRACITKQVKFAEKLYNKLQCITKERELVKLGFDTYVLAKDVTDYIENVSNECVKVIDLPSYERDIPNEAAEKIIKAGDLFDNYYVVFTDYTGEATKKVEKARQEKDPILFGTLYVDPSREITDERFFFIHDWVDEFCHLTLDDMISEMSAAGKDNIKHTVDNPPVTLEELKSRLNEIKHGSK